MLRISVHTERRYRHRFDGIFQVKGLLRELGYQVAFSDDADTANKADIAWVQGSLLKEYPEDSRPKICYERFASGTIEDADNINREDVALYTKEIGYLDQDTYLQPLIDNRLHTVLASPESSRLARSNDNLDPRALEKVAVLHAIYRQEKRFNPYFARAHQKLSSAASPTSRSIDVFYAGNPHFADSPGEIAGSIITAHRKKLAAAITSDLPSNISVLLGLGRCFSPAEFRSKLTQAKIFVSPYGWGEYSWKDFEAAISGCIVVKPASKFLKSYGPPLYQDGIVECRPDYSDLQEIVETILENIDEEYQRAQNIRRQFVKARFDNEGHAKDLATVLSAVSPLSDRRRRTRLGLFAGRFSRA